MVMLVLVCAVAMGLSACGKTGPLSRAEMAATSGAANESL
jgi:predicted small lipoprotein YifL